MHETTLPILTIWQNFYVIIGSASAALIGLMFVTITLIAGLQRSRSNDSIAAFGTPNVVHFCAALLIAALLTAPWQVTWHVALPLGLIGSAGIIYTIIVIRRARHQNTYQPVMEDWLWHIILPFIAYGALFVAAFILTINPIPVLFIIAAVALLFIFIGIHNSWDTVTFIAAEYSHKANTNTD